MKVVLMWSSLNCWSYESGEWLGQGMSVVVAVSEKVEEVLLVYCR